MAESLTAILSSPHPPACIHLHHPHHPPAYALPPLPSICIIARVDAVEHHTPRLLFSGVLRRVADQVGGEVEEVSSWDGFARGLREVWTGERKGKGSKVNGAGKGKGKEKMAVSVEDEEEGRVLVVAVTKAERLRRVMGEGWAVITRLAELTGLPACVVLASTVPWDELRPPRGDALEPMHICLSPLSREETLRHMLPASEHPVWPRFLDLLLATLSPLLPSSPPSELAYLASALWPIYTSSLPPHFEQHLLHRPYPDPSLPPPPLAITVKLLTDLKAAMAVPLAAAIEFVLPRLSGSAEFTDALLPRPGDVLGIKRGVPRPPPLELPLVARFLVVAAYCASYNPAKSDLRLFGRAVGGDGKRKRGGGTRRAGYGRVRMGKVPQRLLGPKPFPLDRLLALFAALYAEHAERPQELQMSLNGYYSEDSDEDPEEDGWLSSVEQQKAKMERRKAREDEMEERWEDEVWHLTMSVRLWGVIPDLEEQGLLRRMSPQDRLDNIMLRCEVDYETTNIVARRLRIKLDEYLYEAAM